MADGQEWIGLMQKSEPTIGTLDFVLDMPSEVLGMLRAANRPVSSLFHISDAIEAMKRGMDFVVRIDGKEYVRFKPSDIDKMSRMIEGTSN